MIEGVPVSDVIRFSVGSDVFIGTTSKISLWIAIFRMFFKPEKSTFIPEELAATLKKDLRYRYF
jgi:hypothetical protein